MFYVAEVVHKVKFTLAFTKETIIYYIQWRAEVLDARGQSVFQREKNVTYSANPANISDDLFHLSR